MTLNTLHLGKYGITVYKGHAGFLVSTVPPSTTSQVPSQLSQFCGVSIGGAARVVFKVEGLVNSGDPGSLHAPAPNPKSKGVWILLLP